MRTWTRALVALLALAVPALGGEPPGGVVRVEHTSPHGRIRVADYPAEGLRCLEFPPTAVRQWCMRRTRPAEMVFPYLRAMFAAMVLPPNPRQVLVVGLGGGSLTRALQRSFPYVRQTIVESDPELVQLCREFFGFVPTLMTQVELADARTFLGQTRQVFDAVFLDANGARGQPRHLVTVEFFRLVRSRLRPGGVVVSHLWGPPENELYLPQLATIAGSFPSSYLLHAGAGHGNGAAVSHHVVVAVQGKGPTPREWVARAAQLQAMGRLDFDLVELLRRELTVLSGVAFPVEPLRDGAKF